MPTVIARIVEVFIYPVKSMAGVAVSEAQIAFDGILGDRQYSFVRANQAAGSSFPWMTARESASMLAYKPAFVAPPTKSLPEPPLQVQTPAGNIRDVSDPALCEEIATALGAPVFLLRSSRGIFDCQHLSLFSMPTISRLADEAETSLDRRQFRANLYIEPVSGEAFEEEAWTGLLLQIGDTAIAGVTQRDSRCMMINLHPDTGISDPKVLKTVAGRHMNKAGLYANVIRGGPVRPGDNISVLSRL